jgi:hypothetical protein
VRYEDPNGPAPSRGATTRRIRGVLVAVILSLICVIGHAQAPEDARDILKRARQTVMNTVGSLPRYVCTETIDRARYEPDASRYLPGKSTRVHSCDTLSAEAKGAAWRRQLSSTDRLRLDVAVAHDQPGLDSEMYSWAGEERFGDQDLFEMVHDGAISTGSFSSMLASIFGGQAASFSYNGDATTFGGRLLSEFGFRVPLERSRYLYVLGDSQERQVRIEYDGSIFVDPETSDLVRLVVRASHLPEESSTCEITQMLDYSRVNLHGSDFLLPAEARITALHADGSQAENVIHYSACHEFLGESSIRYERVPEPASPGPGQAVSSPAFELPAGVPFKIVFTQSIDLTDAAAGDPIRAKLRTPIRGRSSRILVPEGAGVTARIVNIRHFYGPVRSEPSESRKGNAQRPVWVIKMRLEMVEVGGRGYPLRARSDAGVNRFTKSSGGVPKRVEIGGIDRLEDADDGVFEFFDPKQAIVNGLESSWVTMRP